MMVPRLYLFQGPQRTSSKSPDRGEKPSMGRATTRPRSTPPTLSKTETRQVPVLARTTTEPVSIPTSPMLIQPRYHPSTRSPSPRTQTVTSRGQHGGRKQRKRPDGHDPNALPPAVAALLAVTAIPPPRGLQRRRSSQQTRVSIDELIKEWRQDDGTPSSEGHRSPLDILLEPADEAEEDDMSLHEVDDEKEAGFLSSRSVSSESISSTPSLDAAHSTVSSFSTPSTPSYRSRKSVPVRSEKLVTSPRAQNCLDDHPLRSPSPTDSEVTIIQNFTPRVKRTVKHKSTLKSNLTASLNALKSAAKSFSNFTAPSIPSDDMLTRSLFTARFATEMRPKNIDGVPDPALRRYLNPTPGVHQALLSSPDFSAQLREALSQPTSILDDDDLTPPMIQMQTYSRNKKRSRGRGGPTVGPDRGEAAVLGQSLPAIRQREPRENSDFLRVIVLEMNMRRTGKLDAKGPGRARVWLPPRRNGEVDDAEMVRKGGVPERWVGMSSEDF